MNITVKIILKTNEKLIHNWNELLLAATGKQRDLINSDLVEIKPFSWLV